jgi:tetratricopeptide (TPR) repeat protein
VDKWTGRRQWGGLTGTALAALMAAGCASGDAALANSKVSQAERAINEAKQGNAGVTAPVELKTAEDKLTAARASAAKGDYDEAMRQADQALVDADYARARATNTRVKKIADDMRQNIQTLRQELDRLPR